MRKLDNLILKTLGYPPLADQILDIVGAHAHNDLVCVICGRDDDTDLCLPEYSTDIKAAWELMNQIRDMDFCCISIRFPVFEGPEIELLKDDHKTRIFTQNQSETLAICLAFLRAKGITEDEIKEAIE
jgi:hypothetical protein